MTDERSYAELRQEAKRDLERMYPGALRAAKQPQDYAAAKRIGVIPNVSEKIQNRVPGD